MQPWRVRDIMTTDVITARENTSIAEIASLLTEHRVSGIPIVDQDRRPLGVVSEAHLLVKVAATGRGGGRRWWRRGRRAKEAAATSARDLMSGPSLTIAPDESLSTAARQMRARKVQRLLVTGESGELLGIVTPADLLRPYARPDADIHRDVTEDLLRRTLWIGPSEVRATVDAGIVTL
ncbi:MAG TPA: CBS domain-containing protein, partial [Blastococcus sp.]|nr:CBS domain-containing protein [Blastococcus sp.]